MNNNSRKLQIHPVKCKISPKGTFALFEGMINFAQLELKKN